ncbi:thiolase family protein [Vibrio salinus]|uniref:thiolase family protein n=1 Tax=Vibrio salinus TaxID=2899784 RepID=UPI001E577060|nr:thiolase family protein [Vibrio salinus]MCE0495467.1 thiolase family protein [Vibrio salinus]
MSSDEIYIVAAKRTPIGSLLGQFSEIPAPILGATAIKATINESGLPPGNINEVIMGCVLTAGIGQAPARQAMIQAGIPLSTGATTVNKVCGSGMKALILAHDTIAAGSAEIIMAGGMESMSNAPHLLQIRPGIRLGDAITYDHLTRDGIDNYDGRSLGLFSEDCAGKYQFSRAQQDAYATESVRRSQHAQSASLYNDEIAPVEIIQGEKPGIIAMDELPQHADISRIPTMKPAFKPDGTITPATASGFSDGAAAIMVASQKAIEKHDLTPIARIVAHTTFSQEPEWFTTAPVGAIRLLLNKTGWTVPSVDLFEINEALAVVPLAAIEELDIPLEKLNVHGGACSLGHPIGASGARIVVTLIHALRSRGLKKGIASLCIGGGEATAVAIECL